MLLASSAADYGTDPSIDRPILLLGTGRSGTTLALDLLARHPEVTWASQFTSRLPRLPYLACYSRMLDYDRLRRRLPTGWWVIPRPTEPNVLLRHVTDGVFTQPQQLLAADVTPSAVKRYRYAVRQHLRWHGKARYVQKHTGFPRVRYLRTIFPDARFIHVLRDGRAVAHSLARSNFFDGTMSSWWWGPMRPEYEQEYAESGEAPIVLAAIVWKTLVDMIESAMAELPPHQGMTVRYDMLITRPEPTLADLCAFSELEPSPVFDRRIREFRVSGSDEKWKQLPRAERSLLEDSLEDHLARLGFS